MVNFKKALEKKDSKQRVSPIEIYDNLDRVASVGPLRPIQEDVLSTWYNDYLDKKDVIIKLHTGAGKTLIGLLALQSRLNMGKGPCVYVCPNIQLAQQVASDADKFGVKYVLLSQGDRDLPIDFVNSKRILITHVQKVFNGKTIFKLDNQSRFVNTFLLDDSHACIDSIRSSFSISIKRRTEIYIQFLSLFEDSLKQQREGSFYRIKSTEDNSTFMVIPYWDWRKKKGEVIKLLIENEEVQDIGISLPLLQDIIDCCTAYISGTNIEIVPDYSLISRFGSFCNAGQRIMMSATTQDDSFFIKGLGLSKDAILSPITSQKQKWSGEKMILFPSLVSEKLNDEYIRTIFSHPNKNRKYGIAILVPSYLDGEYYGHKGAIVANRSNLQDILDNLKSGVYEQTAVFVNRYDGIDLADNRCRILLIDSLPYFDTLGDRYEEYSRKDSDITYTRIAQKIEQGLGRSVRGEKDYSVILILGKDLINFLKNTAYQKYFSPQTLKQIQIGEEVTKMILDDGVASSSTAMPEKMFGETIRQCTDRDEDWKAYYYQEMEHLSEAYLEHPYLDVIEKEAKAELFISKRDFYNACMVYQELSDSSKNVTDKGWYLQLLAKYKTFISETEALIIQKSAHDCNTALLLPQDTIYKKIVVGRDDKRCRNIVKYISKYSNYSDLRLEIEQLLSDLTFGVDSEKFEQAVYNLGIFLGLHSQRPDKEFNTGPDNLWASTIMHYIVIECKNEVIESRKEISKSEVGQMENHCGWFETKYPEVPVRYIMIHQTTKVSKLANFTHDVRVMNKENLERLKNQIRSFVKELKCIDFHAVDEFTIAKWLQTHNLSIKNLEDDYCETCKSAHP